jgi:hypothetical protein
VGALYELGFLCVCVCVHLGALSYTSCIIGICLFKYVFFDTIILT